MMLIVGVACESAHAQSCISLQRVEVVRTWLWRESSTAVRQNLREGEGMRSKITLTNNYYIQNIYVERLGCISRGTINVGFWFSAFQSKTSEQSWNESLILFSGWLESSCCEVKDWPKSNGNNGTHKTDDIVRHAEVGCRERHQHGLRVQPQHNTSGWRNVVSCNSFY